MTVPTSLRLLLAALVAIPLLALTPRPAGADDRPRAGAAAAGRGSAVLELEVTEVGAQRRRAARFTLALEHGSVGVIDASSGPAHFKVQVRTELRGSEPVLDLELERTDRTPEGNLRLALSAPVRPGQRKVLATLDRADGKSLEIAATLR